MFGSHQTWQHSENATKFHSPADDHWFKKKKHTRRFRGIPGWHNGGEPGGEPGMRRGTLPAAPKALLTLGRCTTHRQSGSFLIETNLGVSINGGTPVIIHFRLGFSLINHPASLGLPPFQWKSPAAQALLTIQINTDWPRDHGRQRIHSRLVSIYRMTWKSLQKAWKKREKHWKRLKRKKQKR